MTTNIKGSLLGGAAALALSIGFGSAALAGPITFNPSATNPGNGTGGSFPLDSAQGVFGVSTGSGLAYSNLAIASATGTSAFTGDMVINITAFAGGADGIGTGYQLFALVTLTGTGTWSGSGASSAFTANNVSEQLQIYGVNTSGGAAGLTGSHSGYTFERPHDDNTAPANNVLTPGESVSYDNLTNHAPSGSGETYPNFNTSGTINDINPSNNGTPLTSLACWDGTGTIGPNTNPTKSNCILLADGTVTSNTLTVLNNALTESFSLSAMIDPESYAAGASGFFGSDPAGMLLSINTGTTEGVPALESICDPGNCSHLDLKEVDSGTGSGSTGSDAVVWAITAVPEPGSLALFGTALLGFGFASRRKRKST